MLPATAKFCKCVFVVELVEVDATETCCWGSHWAGDELEGEFKVGSL